VSRRATFGRGIVLAAIIGAALLLRLYQLQGPSLWIDEAYSYWFSNRPLGEMLATLRLDAGNLPLYFILGKFSFHLLGPSDVALRLPAALAGLAGVALAYMLGWRAGGTTSALVASGFWAFHPMAIWYARDGKPYALAAAFSAASLLLFASVRRRPTRSAWILAGVVLSLGLITHYYFVLVAGALIVLALLDIRRAPRFFRCWTAITLIAAIPLTAWVTWVLLQPEPHIGIGWIAQPVLPDIPATLWNMASGYGCASSAATTSFGILAAGLALVGMARPPEGKASQEIFVGALLLPILTVWVVSQWRAIYMDRYFIVLLPFMAWLVGGGAEGTASWLSHRFASSTVARSGPLLVCGLMAIGLWAGVQVHTSLTYVKEDWRALARTLALQPDDELRLWFSDPESVIPFQHYYLPPFVLIDAVDTGSCAQGCWLILRQPYTATHAYAQSVSHPRRPWRPELPAACRVGERWQSATGLEAWQVECNG
jgi:4-amino-4-deoxy-L-arabinose transferase-like glycosyltransferase